MVGFPAGQLISLNLAPLFPKVGKNGIDGDCPGTEDQGDHQGKQMLERRCRNE